MINLSIIIVSFNTKEMTFKLLRGLKELKETEIIVVDNESRDGTVEEIQNAKIKMQNDSSKFKIIRNENNLGFAKANNIGIKNSTGRYILLLNSDTIVEPEAIEVMCRYLDLNHDIGVATCRVELENGKIDPACHRGFPTLWASLTYFTGLEKLFPKSKLFGQYHLGFMDMTKSHEIDSPTGAFYMVRREVVDKVGLLDEDYFMYGEDLDWSFRIKQQGYKIFYNPEVKIIHLKKQSGRESENKELKRQTDNYFYETMELFYRKHYMKKYPKIISWLIIMIINIIKHI